MLKLPFSLRHASLGPALASFVAFSLQTSSIFAAGEQATLFPIPAPPQLDAKAYILIDGDTHKVLAEKNADQRVEPASLTKLMTAFLTEKAIHAAALSYDQMIPISKHAWSTEGSRMFVDVGSQVKVQDLLHGVIIQSGNDASVALAEAIAGSEDAFASLMNTEAQELGMENSHFANATGLPHPNHYSSAHDMAILAMSVINDFPEDYDIYKQKWFTYNNIRQPNRNRLIWSDDAVDGLKTGHTDSAGFCLVASAKKNNMRLISVVIGAKTEEARTADSRQLLAYGFSFYETHTVYSKDVALKTPRVWMGKQDKLPVGLTDNLTITVPKGHYRAINAEILLNKTIKAPIKKGEEIGKLVVTMQGDTLEEKPLVALADVARGSLWTRLSDYVNLKFRALSENEKVKPDSEPAKS